MSQTQEAHKEPTNLRPELRTADIIPISSARQRTEEVLNESPVSKLQALLDEVTALEDKSIDKGKFNEYENRANEILQQAVKAGIISIDSADRADFIKIQPRYESDGQDIKQAFRTIIEMLKVKRKETTPEPVIAKVEKEKPATTVKPAEVAKKDSAEKPADNRRGKEEVNPLAIEIDGMTFESLADALSHANRLGKQADAFRTKYYASLEKRMEAINRQIDSGIEAIKKADRIATSGRNIGVIDIMKPFVARLIVKYNGTTYRPNPDIKKAKDLAEAANAQIKRIYEEVKRRKATYESILHSNGGFERVVPADDGKGESARYAYQIHIEKKAGNTIIVVDKVEVKFTDGSVRLLRQGNEFLLGHSDTPPFLNESARTLIAKQGQDNGANDKKTK